MTLKPTIHTALIRPFLAVVGLALCASVAAQTAQPLARALGLPVETIEGWAEADRHVARYRSTETLRALGESEWRRFLDDPIAYFGGDGASFRSDVLGALAATVEAGPADAHVAVFTHGLPINVVLSHALGLERIVHFAPGYASVTRLRLLSPDARPGVPPQAIGVASVNERGHLPPNPADRDCMTTLIDDATLAPKIADYLATQLGHAVTVGAVRRFPVGFSWLTYAVPVTGIDGGKTTQELILRLGPDYGLFAPYSAGPQVLSMQSLEGS
eukprot:gene50627-67789_t